MKRNEIKGVKEKENQLPKSCGKGNYASFSRFNGTRAPAPRLTVKGLILYAKLLMPNAYAY